MNTAVSLVAKAGACVRGERGLIEQPMLGVLSSQRTPLELYLPLIREVELSNPVVLAGPFQSPLERLILRAALSAGRKLVLFPARDPCRMRLPRAWEQAIERGSLALVAPAGVTGHRANRDAAALRDRLFAAWVEELLVGAAVRGGRAYSVVREVLERGRPARCLDHEVNEDLLLTGCRPIPLADFSPQESG